MKTRKQIYLFIITSFLVLNSVIISPKVHGSIEPGPDQFIAEIFPNCTSPLQLFHTSILIIVNATGSSNKMSIHFDANYTIYNPENTTTVLLVVLFSLAIDIADLAFEVHANNTQIPYNLFSTTTWDENITAVEIYWLPGWIDLPAFYSNPVIFIRSNVTLFKNSTSVIRYQISSPMNNFFDSKDLVYITYYLGTSKEWIGDTSGRVNLTVYGKQPVFAEGGDIIGIGNESFINIDGGRSLLYEWKNVFCPWGDIGFRYYRDPTLFEVIGEFILKDLLPFIIVVIIITAVVIIRKRRKRVNVI